MIKQRGLVELRQGRQPIQATTRKQSEKRVMYVYI